MGQNIAIISGEISGDLVAGALVSEINRIHPGIEFWGIGSRHSAAAGVSLEYDSSEWSAIGVIEVLKVYPKLRWSAYPSIVKKIESRKPAVVILVDFGVFNMKVARDCKRLGIPVVWYFPPGSWRQKGTVGPELAQVTTKIATPFPWSEERLKSIGSDAEFVGHPLLELTKPTMTSTEFASKFGLFTDRPTIGLLPGSRGFEVQFNTMALLRAAQRITVSIPNVQFVIGAASDSARKAIERMVTDYTNDLLHKANRERDINSFNEKKLTSSKQLPLMVPAEGVPVSQDAFKERLTNTAAETYAVRKNTIPAFVITQGHTYDVMAHSDFLMICSGTATLEAAILNTPMLILYCGSSLMYLESKIRRIRPEHIGMPNIIAGRRIVPEFIQEEASPEALSATAVDYLLNVDLRLSCKEELRDVRKKLMPPGTTDGENSKTASERTAELVLRVAHLA